jgi:hypothetical protein
LASGGGEGASIGSNTETSNGTPLTNDEVGTLENHTSRIRSVMNKYFQISFYPDKVISQGMSDFEIKQRSTRIIRKLKKKTV